MSIKRKLSRRKKQNKLKGKLSALRPSEVNILKEIEYISQCAQKGDGRLISILSFILFSTEDGDAWILEPDDNLALQLVKDFEKLPHNIKETDSRLAIEWNAYFDIENDIFTVNRGGKISFYASYPTDEIIPFL